MAFAGSTFSHRKRLAHTGAPDSAILETNSSSRPSFARTGVADQLRELASGIESGISSVHKLAGALQQVGKEISAEIEENQKSVGSLRRTIDAEADAIAISAKARSAPITASG